MPVSQKRNTERFHASNSLVSVEKIIIKKQKTPGNIPL